MSAIPANNNPACDRVVLRLLAALAFNALRLVGADTPQPGLPPSFQTPVVVRSASAAANPDSLHIVTWNIDQGKRYSQVLATLQQLNADLLLLQEVDSGTTRTAGHDVAPDLARQLGLNEAFGVEFEELSQESGRPAYTGQATLTRLPIRGARILRFQNQSGFWQPRSWLPASIPLLQRRLGDRISLVTEVEWRGKLLVIYNLHLESRSYGRIQFQQLDEVLADCAAHYPGNTPILLGGDLNSKYLPSRYLRKLEEAGFRSATGKQIERTHTIAMALDWLFSRGLPPWQGAHVDKAAAGSDHYPVDAKLSLDRFSRFGDARSGQQFRVPVQGNR